MSERKWTDEQQSVIDARNCDLLVSAAAGSGKTAVLVERIIQKVTDQKHPMDIDKLLVVTFTKAAAREMKERIREAITKAAEADPKNSHLALQMTLVHNAQITTIDSFCTSLVRNNFHKIDLEPDFRIADEGEMKLLRQDVLDRVFEALYEEKNEGFLTLVRCYAAKNRDTALQEMVLKLYDTAQSYPWPMQWLREITEVYRVQTGEELENTLWMQWFMQQQKTRISDVHLQQMKAIDIANLPDGPAGYLPMLEADAAFTEGLMQCDTYSEMQTMFSNMTFPALSRKKSPNEDLKTKTANIRKAYKSTLESVGGLFADDLSSTADSMKSLLPVMESLTYVCTRFMEEFSAVKRQKNILDFGDLEHMALAILREEDGTLKDTAYELQKQFEEVMVDEYQDSNYLQEAILTAAAKADAGGHNMFMVGDVKQSIYSFRQARPDLFMDKMHRYPVKEGESSRRIDLAKNFRSRAEVLETTNDIFYRIMAEDLGNVPYDDRVALYTGNKDYRMPEGKAKSKDPKEDPYACEVLIADSDPEALEQMELDNKVSLEAKIVGDKMRELKKTLLVTDSETKELRPVRWGDIVILMRSPASSGSGEAYVESLMEQGIPAHLTSSEGYFDTAEVSVMLSLLSVINNQMQDIPLMAVMHSKIGGFTNEDAMIIRGAYPKTEYFHESYEKVIAFLRKEKKAAETGGQAAEEDTALQKDAEQPQMEISKELADRLITFQDFIDHARRRAEDVSIHVLIAELMEETGYLDYVTGLPAGAVRRANLLKLADQAITFESTSYRGLSRFMKYIEKLKKYEVDFGSAELIGEEDDAVRIISIHKSKGLEYPVVFLSGCGKNFNEGDTRGSMVIQSKYGVAIDAVDPDKRIKQKPVYKSTLENMIRTEMLGEELRILYVALTRAKEKLIITGTMKDAAKKIASVREASYGLPEKTALSFSDRYNAKSYLDWILPALLADGNTYEKAISVVTPKEDAEPEEKLKEAVGQQEDILSLPAEADPSLVKEITERLAYVYPYQSVRRVKAKYSVSEIKHRAMQKAQEEVPQLEEAQAEGSVSVQKERTPVIPKFMQENPENGTSADTAAGNRGALRGTAMHRVLECLDFAREDYAVSLDGQLAEMETGGKLTEEQSKLINKKKLQNFLESSLGKRVHEAAAAGALKKEQAFVMGGSEREFFPTESEAGEASYGSDMILVQGIIDGFFEEEDGFVLYDFKTDRVHCAEELEKRYRTQLLLYADAIERTHSKPVKEILIYSFALDEVTEVRRQE